MDTCLRSGMGDSCLIFSQPSPFSDEVFAVAVDVAVADDDVDDALMPGLTGTLAIDIAAFALFLFLTDDDDVGGNGGVVGRLLLLLIISGE